MQNNPDIDADLLVLADEARKLGYVSSELVVNRLKRIIVRSERYTSRRQKRGWQSAYDETVAEDAAVLALAIQLLQSKG